MTNLCFVFFFSSRRRHTRSLRDWSSDVCSSDLPLHPGERFLHVLTQGSGEDRTTDLADCPAGGRTGTGILARQRQNSIGHALVAAPEGHAVPAGALVRFEKAWQPSARTRGLCATEG